jgi:hypothetical protein
VALLNALNQYWWWKVTIKSTWSIVQTLAHIAEVNTVLIIISCKLRLVIIIIQCEKHLYALWIVQKSPYESPTKVYDTYKA